MKALGGTACALGLAIAAPAHGQSVEFAIPAGPLPSAITAFSQASNIQVFADPTVLRGRRTQGVQGRMTVNKGLEALLRGTGLVSKPRGESYLIVADDERDHGRPAASLRRGLVERPSVDLDDESAALSPLVVIGQRIADQRALAEKNRQSNIVDVASSDEVRRLPDITIVDAMRRIPGVSVVPIADNEHPRDIPIAPVVRGLTQAYNNVTINGLAIASTGIPDAASNSATRGVRLDILPASLVSQLVVVKTFTPDLDPNAIGGAIDLQTRSAFDDHGRPVLSIEAGLAKTDRRRAARPQSPVGGRASLTASGVFGAERRLGLMISADDQHLENNSDVHGTSDEGFVAFYDDAGRRQDDDELGNGVPVPQQDRYWSNGSDRRRRSVTARAELDLDDLRLSLLAGGYRYVDGFTRNEVLIDPVDGDVHDQTATSGRFDAGAVEVGYRSGVTRNQTRILQGAADWRTGPDDLIRIRAGLSHAAMVERYDMVKFIAGMNAAGSTVGDSRLAFTYDSASLHHSFNPSAEAYRDLTLYSANYWRHRKREAGSRIAVLHGDWRHRMEADDEGLGFAAGLAWKRSTFSYPYRNEQYRTSDRGLVLADAGFVSDTPLTFNQGGLTFLVIDPDRAWRMFWANQASITRANTEDSNQMDNFAYREGTSSGYGLARYAYGDVELLGGARFEGSAVKTRGQMKIDDVWSPTSNSARYSQLLPSVLINYRPFPSLRVRAGYSRTIGRPGYEAYAPRSAIKFQSNATVGDPESPGITVRLGNPDIRPRRSDNFDVSLEWSLPGRLNGAVSTAFFHKAIRDEIFDATTVGYALDGVFYNRATVTRPVNATSAHISGLEASVHIDSLAAVSPALRHLGINANWTLLSGEMTVAQSTGELRTVDRLVGQPSAIRNLTLFYDRGGFELRGGVSWTNRALRSLTPDKAWQDLYWAPRRQFDLQARYHFGPGLSLIVDAANITGERLTSVTGPGRAWLKDSYSVPRTYQVSLNLSL